MFFKPRSRFVRLVPLLFIAFVASTGCTPSLLIFSKEPEVSFKDISLESLDLEKASLKIFLEIENDNFFSIPIEYLKYRVFLEDYLVYEGLNERIVSLPGNSKEVHEFDLEIGSRGIDDIVAHLNRNNGINYRIETEAKISVFTKENTSEGQILLPRVSAEKINFSEFSFENTSFSLQLSIDNPNPFDIPLRTIQTRTFLEDLSIAKSDLTDFEKIAKEGKTRLNLPIQLNPKRLWESLKKMAAREKMAFRTEVFVDFGFAQKTWEFEGTINREDVLPKSLLQLLP